MHATTGTVEIELDMLRLIGDDEMIDDANIANHETLIAANALFVLQERGFDVEMDPMACLVSRPIQPDECWRYDVQVPCGGELMSVTVKVDDFAQCAIYRLIGTFERAAGEIVERFLALPGERVGVDGWGTSTSLATANLVIVDGDARILWQATCRRDVAGVFEAIDANPRLLPSR